MTFNVWPATVAEESVLGDFLKLIADAGSVRGRSVLLVGQSSWTRTTLLTRASGRLGLSVLPLGVEFSRRAALLTRRQRPLQAATLLQGIVDEAFSGSSIAVIDRLEVLFDRSLRLDALDAIKRLAHGRTVVAAWPGQYGNGRLRYAPAGHPEHCDHAAAGCLIHHLS
ncbi:BREX-3 system P-loop-containing protein BrxF [uncultured Pseudacidovorax sp.]|uniref:BREX-3 system P-loop-containing protein BrxF n=1 Tax=uncultured Pseudacidovorax sp. TaxID=679313 RepID=UPI00345CF46C